MGPKVPSRFCSSMPGDFPRQGGRVARPGSITTRDPTAGCSAASPGPASVTQTIQARTHDTLTRPSTLYLISAVSPSTVLDLRSLFCKGAEEARRESRAASPQTSSPHTRRHSLHPSAGTLPLSHIAPAGSSFLAPSLSHNLQVRYSSHTVWESSSRSERGTRLG